MTACLRETHARYQQESVSRTSPLSTEASLEKHSRQDGKMLASQI